MNTQKAKSAKDEQEVRRARGKTLTLTIVPSLPKEEADELRSCESVIGVNRRAYVAVACALATIRNKKLYRAEFGTFEQYCREKWDFTRFSAYRHLRAAEVHNKLLPIGNNSPGSFPLPENEYQVRALASLPDNLIKQAWAEAVKKAGSGKVTGKVVTSVVKGLLPKKAKNEKTEKLSWQQNVLPLLQKARRAADLGDEEKVIDLVRRIILLLEVGTYGRNEPEIKIHDRKSSAK